MHSFRITKVPKGIPDIFQAAATNNVTALRAAIPYYGVNAMDDENKVALHHAVEHGALDALDVILAERGVLPLLVDKFCQSAQLIARKTWGHSKTGQKIRAKLDAIEASFEAKASMNEIDLDLLHDNRRLRKAEWAKGFAQKKERIKEQYGSLLDPSFNLLEAIWNLDFDRVRVGLERSPDSIFQVDAYRNNAAHLCVISGALIQEPRIFEYILEETEVDLLQRNSHGHMPHDLLTSQTLDGLSSAVDYPNAEEAWRVFELLADYTADQAAARYPSDDDDEEFEADPSASIDGPKPREPSPYGS